MSIRVEIREGYKPKHHFGNPYFFGDLFAIEDSGCWVALDSCTNIGFDYYDLFLPKDTTKEELLELIDDDIDPKIAKILITGLLRSRRRK